ncbi:MAG: YbhB/YbcL family Raf kinase inhibitor-like protein [Alteromonadaceae bacterium]|nr:YbhB/YbcL family Raf kinase inhibitor-like protein [Alteromonadaceae bacterium]
MHYLLKKLTAIVFTGTISVSAFANNMSLISSDIKHDQFMSKAHEFSGFGCTGDDQSPQLSWSGAPDKTKAFAIFAYDPDAPTGSGWWHWQVINIPANVNSLPTGVGSTLKNSIPAGSKHMRNDYGKHGFGGACPPVGHGKHRYQFTVHALSKKLQLPQDASAALTGYMVNAHSIASATLEAYYER